MTKPKSKSPDRSYYNKIPSDNSTLSDTESSFADTDSFKAGNRRNYGNIIPVEYLKTFVALNYFATAMILASIMLQITNQRVEHDHKIQPPLRDLVFEIQAKTFILPSMPHLFRFTEIFGIFQVAQFATFLLIHKHRLVIFRRFCYIVGTVYFYRCLTVLVTQLPVPGYHLKCQPKYNPKNPVYTEIAKRVLETMEGGGTSYKVIACGDYMYSGHTVILVSTCLFLLRYVHKSIFYYDFIYYIWRYIVLSMTSLGIVFVVLAHEHYTVDCIVAYYIVTQIFRLYHGIAEDHYMKNELQKPYVQASLEIENSNYHNYHTNNPTNYTFNNEKTDKIQEQISPNMNQMNKNIYKSSSGDEDCNLLINKYNLDDKHRKSSSSLKSESNSSSNNYYSYKSNYQKPTTTSMFRKHWWCKPILWNESNIYLANQVLPFEYSNPLWLIRDILFSNKCVVRNFLDTTTKLSFKNIVKKYKKHSERLGPAFTI